MQDAAGGGTEQRASGPVRERESESRRRRRCRRRRRWHACDAHCSAARCDDDDIG